MGGRLNGNATAPCMADICGRSCAMIAPTLCARSVRSSYGLSRMTKKAWLDEGDIIDEIEPDHREHAFTPGIGRTRSSTCLTTTSVRLTETLREGAAWRKLRPGPRPARSSAGSS